MARRHHEGSAKDEADDKRGAKALGVSRKAYENTPRDAAEDAAGEGRIPVRAHHRTKRQPPPPMAPPMGQPAAGAGVGLAQPPGADNEPFED